jgi:RAQPRD family integrative conjugative element protein
MKKRWKALLVVGSILVGHLVFADDAQMKESLVKIIHQLEAIKPLLNEAERAQPFNTRIKIHFGSWIDANGTRHLGLRQDILTIQKALLHAVNQESIEPRVYQSIKNDFIGGQDHV